MSKTLFIGGIAHGNRINTNGLEVYSIPIHPASSSLYTPTQGCRIDFKIDRYRKERVMCNDKIQEIFFLEGREKTSELMETIGAMLTFGQKEYIA